MLTRATIAVLPYSIVLSCIASDPPPTVNPSAASPQESQLESDAHAAKPLFSAASLYKPDDRNMPERLARYAPLIVVQSNAGPQPRDATAANATGANKPAPTLRVYTDHGTLTVAGREFEQVTFAWCEPGGSGCERPRGVRMTLSDDGFPIIWEALDEEPNRGAVLYLSKSFEQAASEQFSEPLPGRRFAAERSREESTEIIVADLLPDGPVPMGPYVYLTALPDFAHALVLCRCSPSQVGEFIATGTYTVQETEQSPPKLLTLLERTFPLEGALRWPAF